jgi:organic radical activating enzyme
MTSITQQAIKFYRFKYFWIFSTERCNLSCRYCFYKDRRGKKTIRAKDLDALFDNFPQLRSAEFVISGGEPTLNWPLTDKLIKRLRSCNPRRYILLQTNGTLLDDALLKKIKNRGIGLELGLDGSPGVNSRFRTGVKNYLPRIERSLRLAYQKKIPLSATMTVTPEAAHQLFRNYLYLINKNIKKVEITPQALGRWDEKSVFWFKNQYRQVVLYAQTHRRLDTLSVEYDIPLKKPVIDLIYTPNGLILTNWALLFFPQSIRRKYALGSLTKGKIVLNDAFVNGFLRQVLTLFDSKNVTYREVSSFYLKEVAEKTRPKNRLRYHRFYEYTGEILKQINQQIYFAKGHHDSS